MASSFPDFYSSILPASWIFYNKPIYSYVSIVCVLIAIPVALLVRILEKRIIQAFSLSLVIVVVFAVVSTLMWKDSPQLREAGSATFCGLLS
ncbi:hypothetical protein KSD_57310 [Ktedonobacter sp. SOSP1-85]|nr:hypothetical protein KSD_57310 [Ktedonobacter sp. SOSP1-85]